MHKADIMVSDFSGVIFDFIFLFSKPVVSVPTIIDMRGKDYIDIDRPLWQIEFFHKFTHVIPEHHIDTLCDHISHALKNNLSENTEMHQIYNPFFGNASQKTVDAIQTLFRRIGDNQNNIF